MTHANTVDVRARTLDEALHIGAIVYHPHLLRPRNDSVGFGMNLRASAIDSIVVGTLEYLTPVHIQAAEFVDSYQVNLPLYGGVEGTYAGRTHAATVRQAVVHGPSAPSVLDGWDAPTRLLGVKISRRALEDALAAVIGRTIDRPIEFDGRMNVTTTTGRDWARLARRLNWWAFTGEHADVETHGDVIGSTLVDAVIGTLVRVAPHVYSSAVREATATGAEESVRRALWLMHARAPSTTTVAEIAAETGVVVRTLEKRFRAEWGRTPSEMLYGIRLAYARRSLERDQTLGVTVGDIARRWGLPHAGRFAARYAKQYGESPSVTLGRGRRRGAAKPPRRV